MKRMLFKRFACVLLSLVFVLSSSFTGFAAKIGSNINTVQTVNKSKYTDSYNTHSLEKKEEQGDKGTVLSRQIVLHCGGSSYIESLSHLKNSLFASKEVYSHDVTHGLFSNDLEGFDCVFVDETLFSAGDKENLSKIVEDFVKNGGSVFLPNSAVDFFSWEFLGIKDAVKLSSIPKNPVNISKGTDMETLGELVCDFSKLFEGYTDFEYFSKLDYGYGFVIDTATAVVNNFDGTCIYSMNKFGDGFVFLTNPLLPNNLNVNSVERSQAYFAQKPYAATTAGANSLIKGEFAAFVSKQKHGFSLERTFGSYGTTPIAWQLHYEEITGIENDASIVFSEICKKYNQIPSFTLIRNTYKWFSRYESISYLDINNNICSIDVNEGAYSNGKHVIADNFNLFTLEVEDTGSYFEDLKSAKQRLFPCIYDINGDGLDDIIAGSSDGKIYVFETQELGARWICKKGYTLKDGNGKDIDVGKYSSPVMIDFDGDGLCDVLSGDEKGNINFIRNLGNGSFSSQVVVTSIGERESMPVLGDVDNDGDDELVVGSCNGKVYCFEIDGASLKNRTLLIDEKSETFMSPYVVDINKNGKNDIVAGTYSGFVRRYIFTGGKFDNAGYIMADEPNYKGNNRVKFGNNCTPRFFDADNDGKDELVCGSYEYGLNVPIDSPYFPFKENLKKQIEYIQDNNFYLGIHFYTNAFASQQREMTELFLHKTAFDYYGINTQGVGANQHTWYTSSNTNLQTLESVKYAGFLWDSGWQSSSSSAAPQSSTENVLGYPAFIDDAKNMLAFNTGTLLYLDDEVTDITAKYGLPISVYYHCDFAYNDKQTAENDVKHVAEFTNKHNLSFVKEDQFAKMTAASANMNVKVVFNDDGSFVLIKENISENHPLFDEKYADANAVRFEVSKDNDINQFSSDAEFYFDEENALVVTMNKDIIIKKEKQKNESKGRIISMNVPATISYGRGRVDVDFDDDAGFVSVKVQGQAFCENNLVQTERKDGYTVFKSFDVTEFSIYF